MSPFTNISIAFHTIAPRKSPGKYLIDISKIFFSKDGKYLVTQKEEEWAPPGGALPGAGAEVAEEDGAEQQPRHRTRDVRRVAHQNSLV